VQFRPIQDQPEGSARKVAFDYFKPLYIDDRRVFVVPSMKMRRGMIVEEHSYENTEKLTDGRHLRRLLPVVSGG
jgi:hypothetical protein